MIEPKNVSTDPKNRRLGSLAGEHPYVFITLEGEGTEIDFRGFPPEDLPMVLQELIDLLVADQ